MTSSGLVRRRVGVAGLLAALLVALLVPLASPASAEPDYPPKFNKITASKFVVPRHGAVAFTAQYFKPGSTVRYRVVVHGDVATFGTATANPKGVVHQSIKFDVVGKNQVTFSGTSAKGKPLALSATITVLARHSGAASGSGATASDSETGAGAAESSGSAGGIASVLPHTGAQVAGTVLVALLLVGGGAVLIGVSRKRRHS